jgi:hypothetical protein
MFANSVRYASILAILIGHNAITVSISSAFSVPLGIIFAVQRLSLPTL